MWHDQADDVEVLTKLRGFKVSIEKIKERKEKRERERGRQQQLRLINCCRLWQMP